MGGNNNNNNNNSSWVWLLAVFLCAPVCGLRLRREYHAVGEGRSWIAARSYCRERHTDLAVVRGPREARRLAAALARKSADTGWWIGLHLDASTTEWRWSGDWESTFDKWGTAGGSGEAEDQSDDGDGGCVFVSSRDASWYRAECGGTRPFACVDVGVVLVRENRTWAESLDHCREKYGDLSSLLSAEEDRQALHLVRQAQTERVWTGLRYAAGWWMWVNGDPLEHQAWGGGAGPVCPDQSGPVCGTLTNREPAGAWGSAHCEERRNFLCSKRSGPR